MHHPPLCPSSLLLCCLGVLATGCRGATAADGAAPDASSTATAGASAAAPEAAAAPTNEDEESKAALSSHGEPIVDLSGNFHPPAPLADSAPRAFPIGMATDVRKKPDHGSARVGVLRAGSVVEIEPAIVGKAGCPDGWRKVKPFGFVCVGGDTTLDANHPIARATRAPDFAQKLPYMYGIATRGGPIYARVPSAEDVDKNEPNLDKHLSKWERDKTSGATYGVDLWHKWKDRPAQPALEALAAKTTDPDVPGYLQNGGLVPNLSGLVKSEGAVRIDELSRRNGVAFIDSFLVEGRRWNVSTDLRVMPADRFRPIRGSDFHGWEIPSQIDFPFALIRRQGAKKYSYDSDSDKLKAAGDVEWRSAVPLTGKQKFFNGRLHYETKDGFWIGDQHAGRVDPAKKMPGWAKKGEKWIDINITKQILVAYEGEKAVFVTLVSTGEAGLEDHTTSKATKRGIFRIHTKYVATTMDSDTVGEEFELRDVPYVQYFEEGYALHGAYWHDGFGKPKSHGCINLAPEDARRLFFWTEPQLPIGWHGVAKALTGTVIFVHP